MMSSLEVGSMTNLHKVDMAPFDGGGLSPKAKAMVTLSAITLGATLLSACQNGEKPLSTVIDDFNATATRSSEITETPYYTDQEVVDPSNVATVTPEESPTPTATATVEAEPWVDLPVQADIVEKNTWAIPDAWEVGSSRRTNFFAVVEKGDGSKYIIWQPYEVDPNDYVNATMYWVQNGIDLISGQVSINGSSANGVREILNEVHSDTSDIDGIILGDLDGAKYNSGDYSNLGGLMMGKVSESLNFSIDTVNNIGVVLLLNPGMRRAYIFNNNSSLPEEFLSDKGDWHYIIFPFASGTDNSLDIFNGYSRRNEGILGEFELQEDSLVFILKSNEWTVESFLDLNNLENEE